MSGCVPVDVGKSSRGAKGGARHSGRRTGPRAGAACPTPKALPGSASAAPSRVKRGRCEDSGPCWELRAALLSA